MKLTQIASNQTQLELSNGTVIFFSYNTPVAAYTYELGYIRTKHKWSKTTSKHINKWLGRVNANEVDQSVIDNLAQI